MFTKEGIFTVILTRPQKTSEKTSEKILNLIKGNNQITIEELSEQLGKTTRAIELQIKKLKDQNLIERIGPDKGGYWKVVNNKM